MIAYTCPNCGRLLRIREEYAGQWGRCKYCNGRVLAPAQTNSGMHHHVFKEVDNRGTRLEDVADANAHWTVLKALHREEPGLVHGFDRLLDAHEALAAIPCIHVAEDSGRLICTEQLSFGYYELNDQTFEAVLCGAALTRELFELAVHSFDRHRGRRKYERPPGAVSPISR